MHENVQLAAGGLSIANIAEYLRLVLLESEDRIVGPVDHRWCELMDQHSYLGTVGAMICHTKHLADRD